MANLPDLIRTNRSLFSDFFQDLDQFFTSNSPQLSNREPGMFVPQMDVEEDEKHYHLTLEVPGMRPEDMKIDFSDRMLTVSGEHRQEEGDEKRGVRSRRYGRFERRLMLPQGVDAENVQAYCENGMLEITIPKSTKSQRRSIEIQSGRSNRSDASIGGSQNKMEGGKESSEKSGEQKSNVSMSSAGSSNASQESQSTSRH